MAFTQFTNLDFDQIRTSIKDYLRSNSTFTDFDFEGIENVLKEPDTDVRIFGKPATRPYRRMGIVLTTGSITESMSELRAKAATMKEQVSITYNQ